MKFKIYILFLLFCLNAFSQREADNWYFGNNAGLNFSTSPPTIIQNSSIFSTKGSSSISDRNGNTVFYSNGTFLKNSQNIDVIETFGGSNGKLTQSAIFIPTNNDNIYHYFTISTEPQSPGPGGPIFPPGLYHYMIDKTLNNGNGGVVPQRSPHRILEGGMSGKMSAVHHSDGKSIWLAVIGNDTNLNNPLDTFYIYKIDENGVNNPIIKKLNTPLEYNDGAIKFSPDGKRLVVTGDEDRAILFNFNNENGTITKNQELVTFIDLGLWASPYGVEFSQDSNLLYVTALDQNNTTYLFQYDINETNIDNQRTELFSSSYITPGALQLSSDGKIYMAISENSQTNNESNYLGVINFPNIIGIRSNYQHNSINLNPGKSIKSLPNFIQSFFRTRILTDKGCLNTNVFFEVDTYANITAVEWDFGDGNFSSEITPNHTYTSSGEFNVTAIIEINNREITVSKKVTIFHPPIVYQNKKIIQCDINSNGVDNFNLNNINNQITDLNLSYNFSFFENYIDAFNNNLSEKIEDSENYENKSNPQVLYARVGDINGCFSVVSFTIESVFVQLGNISNMYSCESSDNINNNFKGLFRLRNKRNEIRNFLNIQPTTTLKFYPDINSAQTKRNELDDNFITTTTTIWVRADTSIGCGGIEPIQLIVNNAPQININNKYTICYEPLSHPSIVLDASTFNDRFEWRNTNGTIISRNREFTLTTTGNFSLTVYKTENGIECSNYKEFTVSNPNPATFGQITVDTETENNTVHVNVNGNSSYQFSLDNQNFFGNGTSYTFMNVNPGLRTIYVRDLNNCEEPIQTNVSVLGYQKFFSPNGDGDNDFWNIKGIDSQFFKSVNIVIFDRFGRIVHNITDFNSQGWDGTYNGKKLASNNYWFTSVIVDNDDKVIKESGNFSLVR